VPHSGPMNWTSSISADSSPTNRFRSWVATGWPPASRSRENGNPRKFNRNAPPSIGSCWPSTMCTATCCGVTGELSCHCSSPA